VKSIDLGINIGSSLNMWKDLPVGTPFFQGSSSGTTRTYLPPIGTSNAYIIDTISVQAAEGVTFDDATPIKICPSWSSFCGTGETHGVVVGGKLNILEGPPKQESKCTTAPPTVLCNPPRTAEHIYAQGKSEIRGMWAFEMGIKHLTAPGCLVTDRIGMLNEDYFNGVLEIIGDSDETTAISSNGEQGTMFYVNYKMTLNVKYLKFERGTSHSIPYDQRQITDSNYVKFIGYAPAHILIQGGTANVEDCIFYGGMSVLGTLVTPGIERFANGGSIVVAPDCLNNCQYQAIKEGELNVWRSTFQENYAEQNGGAIYLKRYKDSESTASPGNPYDYTSVKLYSTSFVKNRADEAGGALYLDNCASTGTIICPAIALSGFYDSNVQFTNNKLVSLSGQGQQMYTHGKIHYESCPPGTYGASKAAMVTDSFTGCPSLCSSGTFSGDQTIARISCEGTCPAGAYCPAGTGDPIPCAAGKYTDETGKGLATACKICPAGFWSDAQPGSAAPSCLTCPIGWSQRGKGKAFCFACLPGYYQSQKRMTNCSACDSGFYQSEESMASCKICPAGYYEDKPASTTCDACLPGQAQVAQQQMACDSCAEGKFQTTPGSTSCDDCPGGWAQQTMGLAYCVECPAGEYQTELGQAFCVQCDFGTFWGTSGSSIPCMHCPQGYYQEQTGQPFCFPCSPGKYRTLKKGTKCDPCAENSFTDKEASSECEDCASGRSSAEGATVCSACAAGQYKDSSSGACVQCPVGYAQPEQDQITCDKCGPTNVLDPGKGSTTGAKAKPNCALCDLGQYGVDNTCVRCPAGFYQDGKGTLDCNKCPINTYSSEEAKSSAADCVSCPERTTTGTLKGQTEINACVCAENFYYDKHLKRDNNCELCPEERTNCVNVTALTLETLPASPGWYRKDNTTSPPVFFSCDTPEDCQGGLTRDQCVEGNTGVLCAVCEKGHVRKGGVCTACPPDLVPDGTTGLATVATIPPFILFCSLLCYFGKKEKEETEEKEKETETETKSIRKKKIPPTKPTKVAPKSGSSKPATNDGHQAAVAIQKVVRGREARVRVRKFRYTRVHGAVSIQAWWLRRKAEPGKSNSGANAVERETEEEAAKKRKDHLARMRLETALALDRARTTSSIVANDIAEEGETLLDTATEVVQGEAEGVVESEAAAATGDNAGDEIEADTAGAEDKLSFVSPINMKLGGSGLGHKVRILVGYLQITSSLVTSFDVPWPPMTLDLLKSLTVRNCFTILFFLP
jgi:hypothetical protein